MNNDVGSREGNLLPPTLKVFDKQIFSLKSPKANMNVLMQPINKHYKIKTSPHKILLYQEK